MPDRRGEQGHRRRGWDGILRLIDFSLPYGERTHHYFFKFLLTVAVAPPMLLLPPSMIG